MPDKVASSNGTKNEHVELVEPYIERKAPSGLYTLTASAEVLGNEMTCYARPFEMVR